MSLPVNMTPDEGMAKSIATKEVIRNEEHTRRICVKLFLENEISRDKDVSKGGRPPWKYGPKTFPTYGM